MKHVYKRSVRIIALALAWVIALSITASTASTASAESAKEPVQPYYVGMSQFFVSLDIPASGRSEVLTIISLTDKEYSADLTAELQKWDNGKWSTIKRWKTNGSYFVRIEQNWYVLLGNKYRVHATATVYDKNGKVLDTAYKDSVTIMY